VWNVQLEAIWNLSIRRYLQLGPALALIAQNATDLRAADTLDYGTALKDTAPAVATHPHREATPGAGVGARHFIWHQMDYKRSPDGSLGPMPRSDLQVVVDVLRSNCSQNGSAVFVCTGDEIVSRVIAPENDGLRS
jgi:hypothetical protein